MISNSSGLTKSTSKQYSFSWDGLLFRRAPFLLGKFLAKMSIKNWFVEFEPAEGSSGALSLLSGDLAFLQGFLVLVYQRSGGCWRMHNDAEKMAKNSQSRTSIQHKSGQKLSGPGFVWRVQLFDQNVNQKPVCVEVLGSLKCSEIWDKDLQPCPVRQETENIANASSRKFEKKLAQEGLQSKTEAGEKLSGPSLIWRTPLLFRKFLTKMPSDCRQQVCSVCSLF